MCSGGRKSPPPPDNSAQLALQREQMAEQKRQFELSRADQQARFEEQKALQTAPPPPAPNLSAEVAGSSLEIPHYSTATNKRKGFTRRKARTDRIPGGDGGGIYIPTT